MVNTAGGLTGGDEFGLRVGANGDTHLTVSTQTAERVYRALGSQNAEIRAKMTVTGAATSTGYRRKQFCLMEPDSPVIWMSRWMKVPTFLPVK